MQSIRLGWFSFYNLLPNITGDNVLAITQAGEPPTDFPASVTFPVGRWTCGLGRVNNVEVRTTDAASGGAAINLNDVRYYLIRSFEGAAGDGSQDGITAVTLDPVTGLLTIE